MSAQLRVASVRPELQYGPDDHFLPEIAQILERLQSLCEWRGQPFLASLLDIARGEAEDAMKTCSGSSRAQRKRARPHKVTAQGDDEGVVRMAEMLACREKQARA